MFFVFIAFFVVVILNGFAARKAFAVGIGIEAFLYAADFHFAFCFCNVARAVGISDFAALTVFVDQFRAGFAVCSTTADFKYCHTVSTSMVVVIFYSAILIALGIYKSQ